MRSALKMMNLDHVLFYFIEIKRLGHKPNHDSYSLLLAALSVEFNKLSEMEAILSEMNQLGIPLNLYGCQAMIKVYLRTANISKALQVFDRMAEIEPGLTVLRNPSESFKDSQKRPTKCLIAPKNRTVILNTLNIIVRGLYLLKYPKEGEMFFERILLLGLKPDSFSFVGPIVYYGTVKNLHNLRRCWDYLIRLKIPIHQEAFISMAISLGISKAESNEIDKVIQRLWNYGKEVNLPCILAFMYAYNRAGNTAAVLTIFEYLMKDKEKYLSPMRISQNLNFLTSSHANLPLLIYIQMCNDLSKKYPGDINLIARRLFNTARWMAKSRMVISQMVWEELCKFFHQHGFLDMYLNILNKSMNEIKPLIYGYPKLSPDPFSEYPNCSIDNLIHHFHQTNLQSTPPENDPLILFNLIPTFNLLRTTENNIKNPNEKKLMIQFFYILLRHFKVDIPECEHFKNFVVNVKRFLESCNYGRKIVTFSPDNYDIRKWDREIINKYKL